MAPDRNDTRPTRQTGGPIRLGFLALLVAISVVALIVLFTGVLNGS